MDQQTIHRNFSYHAPNDEAQGLHVTIRSIGKEFVQMVNDLPPCREQSIAITHIEEAVMWANAAIAREISAPANQADDALFIEKPDDH